MSDASAAQDALIEKLEGVVRRLKNQQIPNIWHLSELAGDVQQLEEKVVMATLY
jgi:hypothetical protein